ncbi:MFS transporter [Marinomonas communis]|uniref:DHA1 family inner membrane transport protein n=1 Tax=Marinomonas communis TaxID=28254 RepID=A0A4V3DGM9_9GAMM|nr:MFS transporter [Marinomonas communis]TDR14941.1 DHA1 family inner membrane transport protein [Marinomonas communis]
MHSYQSTNQQESIYHIFLVFIALASGGLFIGTGEFVSMSLLPDLARAMNISVPNAGAYISAYAVGVVIGAPTIAILGARLPRKTLLIGLIGLFAVGYGLSASAWNHSSLLAGRFIGGLPHGAYYGVACLFAAALVPKNKKAQAAGFVMIGLAAANVVGVPIATWIGQQFGWRATFWALGAAGVITMGLFAVCLPNLSRTKDAKPLSELKGLAKPLVWLTLATAAIGFGGMFAVYSYITPTLTEITGLKAQHVPLVLALWGLGMVVGNLVGGKMADINLTKTILATMLWNVISLALFAVYAHSPIGALATLFMIGCGFALVPALQVRLMDVSGDAQTMAASLNHSAFNISNAIGASLGGLSIAYGFGWSSTGWVGSALALFGIILMMLSLIYQRKTNQ